MLSHKSWIVAVRNFITAALLFSTFVKSQNTIPTPNATLFIPGGDDLGPDDVIVASEVTVAGGSTFYQLLPTNPTQTPGQFLTVTLALTPTQIEVETSDPDDGIVSNNFNCTIHGDEADCTETIVSVDTNNTATTTNIETQTFSAVPISVVALNFGQPTLPSGIPTTIPTSATAPTTVPTTTSSVVIEQVSFSIVGLLTVAVIGQIMLG